MKTTTRQQQQTFNRNTCAINIILETKICVGSKCLSGVPNGFAFWYTREGLPRITCHCSQHSTHTHAHKTSTRLHTHVYHTVTNRFICLTALAALTQHFGSRHITFARADCGVGKTVAPFHCFQLLALLASPCSLRMCIHYVLCTNCMQPTTSTCVLTKTRVISIFVT